MIDVTERTLPWSAFSSMFHPDENVSTAEMLHRAGLANWNVDVEEITFPEGYESDKTYYMTTRGTHDGRFVMSTNIGNRYTPLQNEEAFDFGDALLDGGTWVGAGSFKNGRVVFGTLKLHNTPTVGGITMAPYLVVSTSHDGTFAIEFSNTMINPICLNTLIAAIKSAVQKYKFRHTSSMKGRLNDAREALALTNTYVDLWAEFMNPLADKVITDIRFEEIINAEFAPAEDASKSALTRWDTKREALWDIWTGPTVKGAGIGNTAFGLWNALNEEHGWNMRGRGENAAENVAMSRSGFNPIWNAENNRLLTIAANA
jgi:phage/plasmid-like protein (TIGR03299 family)